MLKPLFLVLTCTLFYGVSLLGNGDAAATFGAPVVCVIVGASRSLFLFLLAALAAPSSPPLPLSSPRALLPVLVVLTGNLGLFFFALLRASGEGCSALCGMVSLYAAIPVLWGMLFRGESVRPLKLLGIALSLAATLLLGLSSTSGAEGGAMLQGPGAPRRVALFLAAITCWGLCDVGSSRLGRDTPLAHTALLAAVGQAVFAAAFALGLFVCFSRAPRARAARAESLPARSAHTRGVTT